MQPPDSDNLPQVQTESKGERCFGDFMTYSKSQISVWCPCWGTSFLLTVPLVSCGSRLQYQCVCRMSPQFLSLKRTHGHSVCSISYTGPDIRHTAVTTRIYLCSLFTALSLSNNYLIIWLSTHLPVCLHDLLSVWSSVHHLTECLSVCLSVFSLKLLCLCLLNWFYLLSASLSLHLPDCLSVCLRNWMFCLFVFPFYYLSACLLDWLSIYLSDS